MTKLTKAQEMWEKRLEELIIKQLFKAWEAGKKQTKIPYNYNLDTDKLGRPIFNMVLNKLSLQKKKAVKKLEKIKVIDLQQAEELGFGGYANQYEHAKDVHNNALDQAIETIK